MKEKASSGGFCGILFILLGFVVYSVSSTWILSFIRTWFFSTYLGALSPWKPNLQLRPGDGRVQWRFQRKHQRWWGHRSVTTWSPVVFLKPSLQKFWWVVLIFFMFQAIWEDLLKFDKTVIFQLASNHQFLLLPRSFELSCRWCTGQWTTASGCSVDRVDFEW